MHHDDVGSVVTHQLAALFGHAVGHDDVSFVALHGCHQSKANALVSAGGLNDDAVGGQVATSLGVLDHLQGHSGLYGASHIQALEFHQDLCRIGLGHFGKADEGRVADGL